MKTKITLLFILTSLVFTMLPCGGCFAAEPTVTREYISRKIGGVKSEEEKLCADFGNLRIEDGDVLRISFLDGSDMSIEEYEIEVSFDELLQNEMYFKSPALQGTEYIEIEFIGSRYGSGKIKLPFKI